VVDQLDQPAAEIIAKRLTGWPDGELGPDRVDYQRFQRVFEQIAAKWPSVQVCCSLGNPCETRQDGQYCTVSVPPTIVECKSQIVVHSAQCPAGCAYDSNGRAFCRLAP
jgi:hypothetical protein